MLVAVAMSFEVIRRDIGTNISLTGLGMCLRVPKCTIFSRESRTRSRTSWNDEYAAGLTFGITGFGKSGSPRVRASRLACFGSLM